MIEYFDRNSLEFLRPQFPGNSSGRAGAALLIEQENGDIDFWADHAPEDSWFAASDQDRERFRRFRHALPELVNDTMRRRGFHQAEHRFRGAARAQSRDAGVLSRGAARRPGSITCSSAISATRTCTSTSCRSRQRKFEAGKKLMLDFARHAVELGGTVSAEHGLGKRKAHLLELQYTAEQIESMKDVKRRLDPQWLSAIGANLFAR